MGSDFGELILESSRAFPDDEEYNPDEEISISFRFSNEGEQICKELMQKGLGNFYVFEGKIAKAFGEGFLENDTFKHIGGVFLDGREGTVDSLLIRPGKKPIIDLFEGPGKIVFALIENYAVPRSLYNDVVQNIFGLIDSAKNIVAFHSSSISTFAGNSENAVGRLFYLKTSNIAIQSSQNFKNLQILPQPNIISGMVASIITRCEAVGKNGLLLTTYAETEFVDSIATQPFFYALENGFFGLIDLKSDFKKLTYNPRRSSKTNLVSSVGNSNMYI